MQGQDLLAIFFCKAAKDTRISVNHIGLYVTLLQMKVEKGLDSYLSAFGSEIMKVAKINSSATYHRLIRELDAYGYIRYQRSFFKGRASTFYLQ